MGLSKGMINDTKISNYNPCTASFNKVKNVNCSALQERKIFNAAWKGER